MRVIATLAAAAACAGCVATGGTAGGPAARDMSPAAVHARILTIDTHVDIDAKYATSELDPGGFTTSQVDLPKMRAGGLDAAFFIVYTAQGPRDEEGYQVARAFADMKWRAITRMAAGYSDRIGLATTADEVEAIAASGRLVALIGMENAYPLGESVEDLKLWYERGVRYVGPMHFGHNQFGDSSNPDTDIGEPEAEHGGLSPLGEELVAEANRLGIMLDVSHASRDTMMDITALSTAPVIASHSGAAAVAENPRNLDDEQLRAIAATGGVAQMVAYGSYVQIPEAEQIEEIEALRESMGLETRAARAALEGQAMADYVSGVKAILARYVQADVSDFVDHIDHAVATAGIDHVGIASDFDGGGGVVGWADASETQAVTEELLKRGYSEEDIAKLWGGNLLRVMRAVEAAAAH